MALCVISVLIRRHSVMFHWFSTDNPKHYLLLCLLRKCCCSMAFCSRALYRAVLRKQGRSPCKYDCNSSPVHVWEKNWMKFSRMQWVLLSFSKNENRWKCFISIHKNVRFSLPVIIFHFSDLRIQNFFSFYRLAAFLRNAGDVNVSRAAFSIRPCDSDCWKRGLSCDFWIISI